MSASEKLGMSAEEAKARYGRLHAMGEARAEEILGLLREAERIFPGLKICLVIRDDEVPLGFGVCQTVCGKGNTKRDFLVMAQGLLFAAAGLKERTVIDQKMLGERKDFAA